MAFVIDGGKGAWTPDEPMTDWRVTITVERKDGKPLDEREATLAASETLA